MLCFHTFPCLFHKHQYEQPSMKYRLIIKDCWFVPNPFIFNVLLGKNDVGYIPRTSSPHHTIVANSHIVYSHKYFFVIMYIQVNSIKNKK